MAKRSVQKIGVKHRARKLYKKAVKLQSKGSPEQLSEAVVLLQQSASLGSGISVLKLSEIWLNPDYPDLYNPEAAMKRLRCLADHGNASACWMLGKQLHLQGNHEEAVRYLSAAVSRDCVPAKALLGEMQLSGDGVEKNTRQGVHLLAEAAEAGNTDAQLVLARAYDGGKLLPRKPERALFWAKQAALAGDVRAQMLVAEYCDKGSGCERDVRESYFWMHQAAKQGSAYAQSYVGECLQEGRGVRRNKKKGFSWYAQAAAQGSLFAITRLGLCYVLGRGVDKDKPKGISLLKEAAEKGYDYALIYLIRLGQIRVIPIEATETERCRKQLEESGHAVSFSEEPVPSGKRKKSWIESEYSGIVDRQKWDKDYGIVEEEPVPNPFDPLLNLGKRLLAPFSRSGTPK